jgi:predicted LPLAT superfamily acyltransferase
MAKWTQDAEFGTGAFRLRLLFGVYRLLGAGFLKAAILPIVLAALVFRKNARRASHGYFARLHAFSGRPELRPTLMNSFRHLYSFAASLVDKLGAWTGNAAGRGVEQCSKEAVRRIFENLEAGKGVFALCSHLGNTDLLRAMASDREKKIALNVFVETSRSREFNAFIARMNPDAALNILPVTEIGIETASLVKAKLEGGEMAAMAADREAALNEKSGAPLDFLGGRALFPKGAFRFLRLMECDFCFTFICRNKKGGYDMHTDFFEAAAAQKPGEVMAAFVRRLEGLVLQYPYQWYNFYDFWLASLT